MFCKRFSSKKVFSAGLICNLISMALLASSARFMESYKSAYFVLIVATSFLGMGFGLLVPALNRMAENLYPLKSDTAVLILNALLGIGTTLAPVFIALFSKMGFWWGLPVMLALSLLILIIFSMGQELPEEKTISTFDQTQNEKFPPLAWVFVSFAFLYGIIETLNGNWVSIYMKKYLNAPINLQALALTSFWAMVTFGRIFIGVISKYLNEKIAFQIAPFISTIAFVIISTLVSGQEYWAVIAFGLTGFGCSILLPLIISFGGKELKSIAPSVPGMIISSYLLGYGAAAFGVGPLEEFSHISLRTLYLIGAFLSFVLGLLSLYIVQRKEN